MRYAENTCCCAIAHDQRQSYSWGQITKGEATGWLPPAAACCHLLCSACSWTCPHRGTCLPFALRAAYVTTDCGSPKLVVGTNERRTRTVEHWEERTYSSGRTERNRLYTSTYNYTLALNCNWLANPEAAAAAIRLAMELYDAGAAIQRGPRQRSGGGKGDGIGKPWTIAGNGVPAAGRTGNVERLVQRGMLGIKVGRPRAGWVGMGMGMGLGCWLVGCTCVLAGLSGHGQPCQPSQPPRPSRPSNLAGRRRWRWCCQPCWLRTPTLPQSWRA